MALSAVVAIAKSSSSVRGAATRSGTMSRGWAGMLADADVAVFHCRLPCLMLGVEEAATAAPKIEISTFGTGASCDVDTWNGSIVGCSVIRALMESIFAIRTSSKKVGCVLIHRPEMRAKAAKNKSTAMRRLKRVAFEG